MKSYFNAKCGELNVSLEDDYCGFHNGLGFDQVGLCQFVCDHNDGKRNEDWINANYSRF